MREPDVKGMTPCPSCGQKQSMDGNCFNLYCQRNQKKKDH